MVVIISWYDHHHLHHYHWCRWLWSSVVMITTICITTTGAVIWYDDCYHLHHHHWCRWLWSSVVMITTICITTTGADGCDHQLLWWSLPSASPPLVQMVVVSCYDDRYHLHHYYWCRWLWSVGIIAIICITTAGADGCGHLLWWSLPSASLQLVQMVVVSWYNRYHLHHHHWCRWLWSVGIIATICITRWSLPSASLPLVQMVVVSWYNRYHLHHYHWCRWLWSVVMIATICITTTVADGCGQFATTTTTTATDCYYYHYY